MGFHKFCIYLKRKRKGCWGRKYRPMLIFWNLMIINSGALSKVLIYFVACTLFRSKTPKIISYLSSEFPNLNWWQVNHKLVSSRLSVWARSLVFSFLYKLPLHCCSILLIHFLLQWEVVYPEIVHPCRFFFFLFMIHPFPVPFLLHYEQITLSGKARAL